MAARNSSCVVGRSLCRAPSTFSGTCTAPGTDAGGPPGKIPGAVNVPLNMDGAKQSERPTTQEEFLKKVNEVVVALPKDRPIITHCGSGGRGGKAAEHLCDAGFEAYNGGGPAHIAAARVYEMTESGELPPYTPPMP